MSIIIFNHRYKEYAFVNYFLVMPHASSYIDLSKILAKASLLNNECARASNAGPCIFNWVTGREPCLPKRMFGEKKNETNCIYIVQIAGWGHDDRTVQLFRLEGFRYSGLFIAHVQKWTRSISQVCVKNLSSATYSCNTSFCTRLCLSLQRTAGIVCVSPVGQNFFAVCHHACNFVT